MLSKRLEALSKDPSNPDSIAELVVTALGPQGSFYICWKTVSGRHEQDSHGLPAALHEWLFPQDGSRRNFETLQVILGPREGEFFASDRHGKRDQKPTEVAAPQQQQQSPLAGRLRRASTLWQQQQHQRDPANRKRLSFIEDPEAQQQPPAAATATATTTAANKRLSFIGDPAAEAKGNRRRSATLSSLGWASSSRRTLSLPKVPLDPAEPEDQRRARRTTLLPLALQAGGPAPFVGNSSSNSSSSNINREAAAATATAATAAAAVASASRRSTSPPSRGPSRAGSLRASASNYSLNSVASRESAGNFSPERRRTPPRPSIPEEEPLPKTPRRPVSVYADACIQTDPVPATAEDDAALSDYQHHHYDDGDGGFGGAARRARGMSTASEASTVFSRAATDTSSRRTSMASDIKIDPAAVAAAAPCWLEQQQQQHQQQEEQLYHQQQQQWGAANFNPNPIVMGRMQDYFRSPAYCLGDAFRPTLGSGMYWGSWRQ